MSPSSSFHRSVESQPRVDFFPSDLIETLVSGGLIALGQLFVLSSFYKLGITGTFLGDYCGIFMEERVTGFPFNVLENPMYVGSTLSFLGYSLYNGSYAGLLITAEVFIVYMIALQFEGYVQRKQSSRIQGCDLRQGAVSCCESVRMLICFASVIVLSSPVCSPYTTQIYAERDASRKGKGKKAQ
jgi:hypothetical protein